MLQQALALDALTELGFKDGWLSRAASFLILGQTHRFEMLQTEGHDHCKATTLVKHTVVQHSQHQSWSHCEDLSHKILDRTLLKKRGDALVCLFVFDLCDPFDHQSFPLRKEPVGSGHILDPAVKN